MLALYSYECKNCDHAFEELIPRSDYEKTHFLQCPMCHFPARRIITNRGAVRDKPTWLESACELAVPDGERCPETRIEWNAYKKKHNFEEKCGYGPVLVSV